MTEFVVRVGVALHRPPREDAVVYVRIVEKSATRASIAAVHMVMASRPKIVMAVSTKTVVA